MNHGGHQATHHWSKITEKYYVSRWKIVCKGRSKRERLYFNSRKINRQDSVTGVSITVHQNNKTKLNIVGKS